MPGLPLAKPEEIGLSSVQLHRAFDLAERWAKADKLPAIGIAVGRKGKMIEPRFIGRHRPDADAPALKPDALFLIASITKPVVYTALMMLVERGEVRIEDPVATYVPKFAANGKEGVLVRHIMTHTSGLPDMVPDNDKLRAAHQPMAKFVEEACALKLLFPPGTKVSYQSMGTLMAAEIVHQVSGLEIREFLRKHIFAPLGMDDTSLGWQPERKNRIAAIRISEEQAKTDWNWNSPYWLGFGAPWGGMITSPADFARFAQLWLNGGKLGDVRLLSPATVHAMTTNQLAVMPQVPEEERRCRPWGLGWKLQWPAHINGYGELVGPRAFGHWGATGTLCWIDPDTETVCVLFSTQPQGEEGKFLVRLSNAIAAAVV
jgi:CubicO group peptidase (beta-lactamase class C family)